MMGRAESCNQRDDYRSFYLKTQLLRLNKTRRLPMLKGTIGLLLLVSLSGCGDVGDTLAGGSGVDAVDSEGLGNAASVAQA